MLELKTGVLANLLMNVDSLKTILFLSAIRKKATEKIQLDVLHPEFGLLKRSRSFDRSSWTVDNIQAGLHGISGKPNLLILISII